MAYVKQTWIVRAGSFLNRFTKSNETLTSVDLDFAGTITDGTEFTAERMNHIEDGISAALPSLEYTASDVLTKIKTVDGINSGLDTDIVRGTTPGDGGLLLLSQATRMVGLTASCLPMTDGTNYNDIFVNGLYKIYGGVNAPDGNNIGTLWLILVMRDQDGYVSQLAICVLGASAGNISVRVYTTSWQSWKNVMVGYTAGNSSSQIPVSNGIVNSNLNADLHDGYQVGASSGSIPTTGGVVPVISYIDISGNTTLSAMNVGEIRYLSNIANTTVSITLPSGGRFSVVFSYSASITGVVGITTGGNSFQMSNNGYSQYSGAIVTRIS